MKPKSEWRKIMRSPKRCGLAARRSCSGLMRIAPSQLFGERIQQQAGKVLAEQEQAAVPLAPLTPGDCFPNSYSECIEGKIVAVKTNSLAPEYRTANHQLVYVTGGNGAQANARGNACFCINLHTGRHIRWERYDIQGEVKPDMLPEWAKERLSGILQQEQAKKEQRRSNKTC